MNPWVVYIMTNGLVMVFDEAGNQISELQGRFADVAEKIAPLLSDGTEIYMAQWKGQRLPITREAFDYLWKKKEEVPVQEVGLKLRGPAFWRRLLSKGKG